VADDTDGRVPDDQSAARREEPIGPESLEREIMGEGTGGSGKAPEGEFIPQFPGAMPAGDPGAEHGRPTGPDQDARSSRTLWGDAWFRLRRNRMALGALTWILIVALAAVSADLWVPPLFGNPTAIDTATAMQQRLQGPSPQHPMGTDDLGRDMFARIVYGARVSLTVGIVSVTIAVIIGLLLGALSGYYGKWPDAVIMRVTDIFLAFPYILFSILVLSILPQSYRGIWPVILVIGLLGWTSFARVFRSSILTVNENDYVDAARALGANDSRIMFRHIAPNAIAPIIVYATISIGGAILTESALSFLGLGVQPPTPSWGAMIDAGKNFLTSNPGLVFWPGLAIVSTVVAFTLLGDGVRDALDVKMTE
jgi:peptide/nickel transport system permease protein/oligopeptide transport system permease protein